MAELHWIRAPHRPGEQQDHQWHEIRKLSDGPVRAGRTAEDLVSESGIYQTTCGEWIGSTEEGEPELKATLLLTDAMCDNCGKERVLREQAQTERDRLEQTYGDPLSELEADA